MKEVYSRYQINNHSESLIPKQDPRIRNFSIPDPRIENAIPGLHSLQEIIHKIVYKNTRISCHYARYTDNDLE